MADIIFTLIIVGIPSGLLLYTIYCESGMDRAIKKKLTLIKENRRKAAQRRKESRMEQPFAAQQSPWADGRFQKNFRGTDGAYGIGRNGSPLKWKCFVPQKNVLDYFVCSASLRKNSNGRTVNWTCYSSPTVYDRSVPNKDDLPSFLQGNRFVLKKSDFLQAATMTDVRVGSEEEADSMITLLNHKEILYSSMFAKRDSTVFPTVWYDDKTNQWNAGIGVEFENGETSYIQFVPFTFLTKDEIDAMKRSANFVMTDTVVTARTTMEI